MARSGDTKAGFQWLEHSQVWAPLAGHSVRHGSTHARQNDRRPRNPEDSPSEDGKALPSTDKQCVVCLQEISNEAQVAGCKHAFCFRCIQTWSEVRKPHNLPRCPLCNQEYEGIASPDGETMYTVRVSDVPPPVEGYHLGRVRVIDVTTSRQEVRSRRYRTMERFMNSSRLGSQLHRGSGASQPIANSREQPWPERIPHLRPQSEQVEPVSLLDVILGRLEHRRKRQESRLAEIAARRTGTDTRDSGRKLEKRKRREDGHLSVSHQESSAQVTSNSNDRRTEPRAGRMRAPDLADIPLNGLVQQLDDIRRELAYKRRRLAELSTRKR